jgi:hypothetical protein
MRGFPGEKMITTGKINRDGQERRNYELGMMNDELKSGCL